MHKPLCLYSVSQPAGLARTSSRCGRVSYHVVGANDAPQAQRIVAEALAKLRCVFGFRIRGGLRKFGELLIRRLFLFERLLEERHGISESKLLRPFD